MSTLKIWETVRATKGLPLLKLDDRTTYQAVTFTGTAGQSASFDADTSVITVEADAACAIQVGANPTAVAASSYKLAVNTKQDLEVEPGQKISVIAT